MNEQQHRDLICKIGRTCYERGYLGGYEGNISVRLDDGNIMITPSGLHKGFLEPEDMIIITLAGERVDTPNEINHSYKSSSETPMHLEAYKQRPDVNAVVHTHASHAVTLSIAGIPIAEDLIPEVNVLLGRIVVTPYATPSSTENADAIRSAITTCDALVLERHGTLTVGPNLMQAFMRTECLESAAKIAYQLALLNVDSRIPANQLQKLRQQRFDMGLARPGETL